MKTILKVQPQMINHITKYVYVAMFGLCALLYALPAKASYNVSFCVQNGSPWHVCLSYDNTYNSKTPNCYAYAPANSIGSWGNSCITVTDVIDTDVWGIVTVYMYNAETSEYVGNFGADISWGYPKGYIHGPHINTLQKKTTYITSGGVGWTYNASGGKDHVITLDKGS